MGARVNREASSAAELLSIILLADNGDVIVVRSEWEKEIGEEILRRERPGIEISFVIESGVARSSEPD